MRYKEPTVRDIKILISIIFVILLFMFGLTLIKASKRQHIHKKEYCPNCYFEKAYDRNGNEILKFKGCNAKLFIEE